MRRLAVLAILMLAAAAKAEDVEGCKDPQQLKRFPGASIYGCEDKEYDEVDVPTGANEDGLVNQRLGGHVRSYSYTLPAGTSEIQVGKNIENALAKAGYKVLVGTNAKVGCCRVTGQSKNLYVTTDVGGGGLEVKVVEVKEMAQQVEADASSMLDEINKSGHVAVYGINFDTGKSAIQESSEAVLAQVAKLLTDNADLKLRVEGHTDNQGKSKDNLELSKKRAAAVKAWLVKKGIDASRLTTDGFGDKKPVGDNKTDEGRAKNRRVELVKL